MSVNIAKKTKEELAKAKQEQRAVSQKKKLQGYDSVKRIYSKQLSFPSTDSTVALMRIADFTKGDYRKFYKKSFEKLDSLHTKTLIIDLRDNTGGRLSEIHNLYSYLADSSFHFVNKSEVTSKTSLWHLGFYNTKSFPQLATRTILLPVVVGVDALLFFKTRKGDDGKYRFAFPEYKLTKPKAKRFKGNVYVLINGGCFSASSLFSATLKGTKRATFVGDETGGAYNGCVAGIMPVRTLPASKLSVNFGLLVCDVPSKTEPDGRGIFPDKQLIPTLNDRIQGTDPELQWVLEDIKGLHLEKK